MLKHMKMLKMVVIGMVGATLMGCAPKTVDSSESSAKILNTYTKKPLPEGWYWNFGIGKNFTKALEDANNSLANLNPSSITTRVTVLGNTPAYKDGKQVYDGNDTRRFVHTDAYMSHATKPYCELRESWDVPEGIMVVRVCPDVGYFRKDITFKQTEEERKQNVKFSFVLGKVYDYIEKKLNTPGAKYKDLQYLIAFKYETKEMDRYALLNNFYEDSDEEIIFWLETTYKQWYLTLGNFQDPTIKNRYGIMFPYLYRSNDDYKTNEPIQNQYWKLTENGTKVSRKLKLSDMQLMGVTPMPNSSEFEYIGPKPKKWDY